MLEAHHLLTGGLDLDGPIRCSALLTSGSVNMAARCYAFSPYASAAEIQTRRLAEQSGEMIEEGEGEPGA